eukprot:g47466.t1
MSTQPPSQAITSASAAFLSEANMIAQVDSDNFQHVFDENKLLMQLSPEDFAKVRRSANGFFCISDAIGSFTECSEDSARKKWCQVAFKIGKVNNTTCKESDPGWHTGVDLPFPVKVFSFPYRSSRADRGKVAPATEVSAGEKRGVACTNLRGLLTILSQFDHPRCKKLQAEMIQVAWCAMAGLPIVLPSAASEQTPSSQVTTKHNASSTKAVILHAPDHERAQVSGIKQHSEPAQESAPGLNDLVSIITNPKHPRSRECYIDLIAISLRATTGNSELASKLANVLASSLEKAGGASTAEQQQQGSSDTAQATSSIETAPLSEPEHEQVQRRKQQPREPLQEHVAKRPRLSLSQAISKQTLGKDNASSALLVDPLLAATAPTVLTNDGKPELTASTRPAERVDKVETEKQELSVINAQEQPPQPAPKSSSTNDTAVGKTKRCEVDESFPVEPRDKAAQSVVMSRGLHDLNNWEEQDISNPAGKRVLRQILTKMKSLYKRSEVKVAPLYLGYVRPLTNTKRFVSRGQVRRRKLAWHVDHIIPASVGGLDHPRNYAIMPQIFNTEFGGWWSAAKAQYITVTAARHALLFAQYVRKKNAWGHGEDHETELELEATLGKEVLGEDLHLYTLEEPEGLVQIDTPEFEMRVKSLRLLRDNNSDAIRFFEERGIPSKYLLRYSLPSQTVAINSCPPDQKGEKKRKTVWTAAPCNTLVPPTKKRRLEALPELAAADLACGTNPKLKKKEEHEITPSLNLKLELVGLNSLRVYMEKCTGLRSVAVSTAPLNYDSGEFACNSFLLRGGSRNKYKI